jgi:N utilization substance protein B
VTTAQSGDRDGPAARRGRHAARLAAVQALYQMELTGDGSDNVARQFVEHRFSHVYDDKTDEPFFMAIVRGVPEHQAEIDRTVQSGLNEDWQLRRIDATLRAILRAAVYELVAQRDVPAKVVIDEYVHIAHAFFEGSEPAFVNASLDGIARRERAREFGEIPPDDELDF